MKYILGSGVVALLAKEILGQEWSIIPFFKSRFFSFNPSLDDNFLIKNNEINSFIKEKIGFSNIYPYKKAYSINGVLYSKHDRGICTDWADKLFPNGQSHISEYMKNGLFFDVYDVRVNELYSKLLDKYRDDINIGMSYGKLLNIKNKTLIFENKRIDYGNIVNTLPLNVLLNMADIDHNLTAKTAHFMHVYTEHLDFEGHNQVLVVDKMFPFYKVSNIAQNRYLFYFHENVDNPGPFFMSFLKDFDILDGTSINEYIVQGELPKLDILEGLDIFSVGSYAQWDSCADISTCILRLIKYANRGYVAKKPDLFL